MDFPLLLDDSDTALVDFDEFGRPANAPTRAAAIDLDLDLDLFADASDNEGGGGRSGDVLFADMSDSDDGHGNVVFNNEDDDDNLHTGTGNSETLFVVESDSELELAVELAVDASGNGGGSGGSRNVVCAYMSSDDDDGDEYGYTNSWSREDAIGRLNAEFCMHNPDREPGGSPHNCDDFCVEPDHPQHDLYMRVLGLINKYYDEIDSEGESSIAGEVKDRVIDTLNTLQAGGYSMDRRHWSEILPNRAELMFTRFVVTNDEIDGPIAAILEDMGRIRMPDIEG
ncbi:hypothetical protein CDV31_000095 [Fusarium ambrosium]|uniref:Uncharacterized protein n=1 Tax=Fusarium ambrosium TaxID=131363 RepID=A0A428V3G2_9HYPO|nr:hypothetical protein CDV31_000095 [Fusarium ambrosium]